MKNILFLFYFVGFSTLAQGDLMITPTRVVFEGNKQREELNLANMGNETATYSISFVQKAMREDGSFENIEKLDSLHLYADPYLRIFPRQVTLAPKESQSIIVQFRRKEGMKSGEYRSHLFFRSEKEYKPLGQDKAKRDSTSLSVSITPIFGMSIPVIIRTGELSVSSSIQNIKLETLPDTRQVLYFTIHRTGNISLYGDITVQYIPIKGTPVVVGNLNGVGVYTTINKRIIQLLLDSSKISNSSKGTLKITYTSKGDGKPEVYADAVIDIK